MNRQERRKQERLAIKERRRLWPSGEVALPDGCGLKNGDKFTIAGVSRKESGEIIGDCEPGTETVWIAKFV